MDLYRLLDGRRAVHYRGIHVVWSPVYNSYRFTFRRGGNNQSFGAPSVFAVCDLIDDLLNRRAAQPRVRQTTAAADGKRHEK